MKPCWTAKVGQNQRSSAVAKGLFAYWNAAPRRGTILLAIVASCVAPSLDTVSAQSRGQTVTVSNTLGANARQVMIDIFRKKDETTIDRYFSESFIQHDPNLGDGLAGMKSFAAEVASSP